MGAIYRCRHLLYPMGPKRPLAHKILGLVLIPLCFELLLMGALIYLLNRAEDAREGEAHASAVIGKMNQCSSRIVGASMYNIIYQLTKMKAPLKHAFESAELMKSDQEELNRLVANDSAEVKEAVRKFNYVYDAAREQILHPFEFPRSAQIGLSTSGFNPVQLHADEDPEGGMKTKKAFKRILVQKEITSRVTEFSNQVIETQIPLSAARNASYNETRGIMDDLLKFAVVVSLFISVGMALNFNRNVRMRIAALIKNTLVFASNRPLAAPVSGDDEIALLDCSFRQSAQNLEDIRRRERAVVENAANVICSVTADGRILSINSAVERLWGYTPEECTGSRLANFVVAEDCKSLPDRLSEIAQAGEGQFENRIKKKDGSIFDTLWTVRLIDSDRSLTCIAHDISERKHLERMKREFSEMMRTGLQSPLETMQAALAEISAHRSTLGEKLVNKAESSQKELSRLFKLLDEFIKLEDLSTFGKNENFKEIQSSQVIDQTVESLKDWALKRKVELKSEEANGRFLGDEDQLVRVLINLVSNAVKFSPQNSTVIVRAQELERFIEFQVIDNGPGIPKSDQAAVFEKFKMLDQEQETAKEGSGLGLAICSSIVARHGGTIGVASDGKTGSTFWFRVPKAGSDGDSAL
jgi:PAS domain S-box-containing protein